MATDPLHTQSGNVQDPVGEETLQRLARAQKFNRWMFERIEPYLQNEVLEIGSGTGNISRLVIEKGFAVTLSDYNTSYQQQLQQQFGKEENVKDILSIDLQHPDFANVYQSYTGRFRSVFLLNVIEHLASEEQAVENCRLLLQPGGHLIVLAPSYNWLYCRFDKELGHYRRYTTKRMASLFRLPEFSIIKQEYFNAAGIAGWWLFGKLLGRKQIGAEISGFETLVPLFRLLDKLVFHKLGLSTITIAKKQ